MSWNGCQACENCEDRTPYTKCKDHCVAFKKWRKKYDEAQSKEKREAWLNAAIRRKRQ